MHSVYTRIPRPYGGGLHGSFGRKSHDNTKHSRARQRNPPGGRITYTCVQCVRRREERFLDCLPFGYRRSSKGGSRWRIVHYSILLYIPCFVCVFINIPFYVFPSPRACMLTRNRVSTADRDNNTRRCRNTALLFKFRRTCATAIVSQPKPPPTTLLEGSFLLFVSDVGNRTRKKNYMLLEYDSYYWHFIRCTLVHDNSTS